MSSGLKTLMAEMGVMPALDDGGEQLDWLDDAPAGPLPSAAAPAVSKGVGRPKGARNRSTEDWRRMLLGRYQSPLVACLELASRTPKQIAEEYGLYHRLVVGSGEHAELVERLDIHAAARIRQQAIEAALPYLHQKQPIAVEQVSEKRGLLVIDMSGEIASDVDALPFAEDKQNQRVIEGEVVQSDEQSSDVQAKPLIKQEDEPNAG